MTTSRGSPPQIEVPDSPSRASATTDLESSLGNSLKDSGLNVHDNTLSSTSQSQTDDVQKDKKKSSKKSARDSGGINDYHIYRQFRLQMVEAFGSLAAAFYEVEREARAKLPDTKPKGEITRFDFFRVIHEKMALFDEHETGTLFAFMTNADLGGEEITVATYKHFGVSEKQWKSVVKQKELEDSGQQTGMFSSISQGTSHGLYLRPMHVQDAAAICSTNRGKKKYKGTPWRNPQKAWEPSTMTGDGPGLNAEDMFSKTRGRWAQMSFSIAPCKKLESKLRYPLHSLLKKPERKKDRLDENTHLISTCPTRRAEMTNPATTMPVPWWPYKSTPRKSSQHAVMAR